MSGYQSDKGSGRFAVMAILDRPQNPAGARRVERARLLVYLDGFSTMPLRDEARAAILEAWAHPANPASPHGLGARAAAMVEAAQCSIAELAGCAPSELTFTSGATEANNIAIIGGARQALSSDRRRLVVSAIEHKSVLEPARTIERLGFEICVAPVDHHGVIDMDRLRALVDERCWMVSAMAVNNETGVIQPIADVARLARQVGALVHCDAAQALGKIPVDLNGWDVDYASVSGHKLGGPVGVGALYVAAGAPDPEPLQHGGGQQGGRRPGTEPAALIAGFGAAAEAAAAGLAADRDRLGALAGLLLQELGDRQVRFEMISGEAPTVPGGMAIKLNEVDGNDICMRLAQDIFLSTGSACTAGQLTSSHVLAAMGFSDRDAASVIRLMLTRDLVERDVIYAATRISEAIADSR